LAFSKSLTEKLEKAFVFLKSATTKLEKNNY